MRHNHPRRNSRTPNLDLFDVEYIDLPERSDIHKIYVLPAKVLYINTAANPFSNINRVFYEINQFADFLRECGLYL